MKNRGRLIVNNDPHRCLVIGQVIHRERLVRAIAEHEFGMNGVDLTDMKTGEKLRVYHDDVYRIIGDDMQKVSWWE